MLQARRGESARCVPEHALRSRIWLRKHSWSMPFAVATSPAAHNGRISADMRLEKPGDFVGERPLAGVTLPTIWRKLVRAGSGAHALEACSGREVACPLWVAADKNLHMAL